MKNSVLLISLFFAGCVISITDPVPLKMTLAGPSSGRDVYGRIQIVFSEPVRDLDSLFFWDPPFLDYRVTFNAIRDTATLSLQRDLSYHMNYTIHGTGNLRTQKSDTAENTISFTTISGEMEPNNNANTADTLVPDSTRAGHIDPSTDEDYFLIRPPNTTDSLVLVLSGLTSDMELSLLKGVSLLRTVLSNELRSDSPAFLPTDTGDHLIRIRAKTGVRVGGRYRLVARTK